MNSDMLAPPYLTEQMTESDREAVENWPSPSGGPEQARKFVEKLRSNEARRRLERLESAVNELSGEGLSELEDRMNMVEGLSQRNQHAIRDNRASIVGIIERVKQATDAGHKRWERAWDKISFLKEQIAYLRWRGGGVLPPNGRFRRDVQAETKRLSAIDQLNGSHPGENIMGWAERHGVTKG